MRTILSVILSILGLCIYAQAPLCVTDSLYDQAIQDTDLGLQTLDDIETVTVFSPTDSTDHFSNGVCIVGFKGSLYCMWQSSKDYEDSPDTWVAYARSDDDGKTWTSPMVLAETIEKGSVSSGGWLVNGKELIAYINVWNVQHTEGCTQYVSSRNGRKWSRPKPVLMADGTPMKAIIEQDPHRLPDGRIVNSAHFSPGLLVSPVYTDDKSGKTGWHKAQFTAQPNNGDQSRELEPSLYQKPDGTLVMLFRDQKSSYHKLASISRDNGQTWTPSVLTNIPDSRSKQCAGNLPDGTSYFISNPVLNKYRYPLVITLSSDGTTFDRAYLLRTKSQLPDIRYNGNAKRQSYSYPKSTIIGDYLYVSYSQNKEDVQYSRIPIGKIGN